MNQIVKKDMTLTNHHVKPGTRVKPANFVGKYQQAGTAYHVRQFLERSRPARNSRHQLSLEKEQSRLRKELVHVKSEARIHKIREFVRLDLDIDGLEVMEDDEP